MNTISISHDRLRHAMTGCWLGKAVGGTLGMPYEGVRHTLNLTFYDPVPTKMLPNDDLDLQVVYAYLLDQMAKPRVDRQELAKAWNHIGMSPDEYGIVKRNLKLGLVPPTTGAYDNPFTRGMGAAIRTELWACLAPGDPDTAVRFAYEDACMDHADEGIDAAIFLAALQSLAFVESDRERLLDRALTYISSRSELAAAIRDTRDWWDELGDWKAVQRRLADRYVTDNFTDVVINLAYIVLGWLAGRDFGEAICIAVNCGQDTDCTGASLGALLGILEPDCIDAKWLEPIGRSLVLSPCITGIDHPGTLDEFTDLVLNLRDRIDCSTPSVPERLQDTTHLHIPATLGFLDVMPRGDVEPSLPGKATSVQFDGNWVRLSDEHCHNDVAVVQYSLQIEADQAAHLIFASPGPVRVWLDGELVIEGEGGEFVPAIHRTRPSGCGARVQLARGAHTITAAVQRPRDAKAMQWFVGFADDHPAAVERDWLVGVFRCLSTCS